MTIVTMISELLLYLCFSIIMGSFILSLLPSSYRPPISVPKQTLLFSVLGIALLSFVPVMNVVLAIYENIGLGATLASVLYTFEIGQAWIVTFILANMLIIYINLFDINKRPVHTYVGLMFTIALMITLGWASHASSLTEWSGFIAHTTHFVAVSIWVGILFVASWFSQSSENWMTFLRWYTPVAITCLLAIVGSGFFMMSLVVDISTYTDSWMIPYGQSLLIKHLLIIPLLVFAFINGFLIRKRMRQDTAFNPKPWAKAESIILLLIFSATAILGQQSPPHDIETAMSSVGVSKLFAMFYQGMIYAGMDVSLEMGLYSTLFSILSGLFLILTLVMFIKRAPVLLSIITSMFFLVSAYLTLMLSVI